MILQSRNYVDSRDTLKINLNREIYATYPLTIVDTESTCEGQSHNLPRLRASSLHELASKQGVAIEVKVPHVQEPGNYNRIG